MKNILAALDFSAAADAALETATTLASATGAHLWLVHVAAPDPDFVGYEAGPDSVRSQVAAHLHEEHREIQARAEALRARGLEATALLVQGPTVDEILSEAERLEADLIVMGSHGHGAVLRTLLGSISEGVLHRAKVPVLIHPRR